MNKNKLFLAAILVASMTDVKAEEPEYNATVDDALGALNRLESKAVRPVPPSQSHVVLLEDEKVKKERKAIEEARKKNMKEGNILKEKSTDDSEEYLKPKSNENWPSN